MHPVKGSFRDPSGYLFTEEGLLKRQVNEGYRADYEHLMSSGLYDTLVTAGLLVPHEEQAPKARGGEGAFKVLIPESIPFISYPYEWCFGQLRDAASATLRIQSLALDHGMSLKDASAFNVQFRDGLPVLIDTLSFERAKKGAPWIAYGQFCRHFLAPLALMSHVDIRLGQLSRVFLDGIPLDLASGLLPGKTKLKPGLQLHLHAHAKSQRRHEGAGVGRDQMKGRFSEKAFRGLIDSLQGLIGSLTWEPQGTPWGEYYEEADHYSSAALTEKENLVAAFLEETSPRMVWDLGANRGHFSRVASRGSGAFTVAFDVDPAAVEKNYRQIRSGNERGLLPLVVDLTNPSPAIGWSNEERDTLVERGPADVALALALIHHLAISNNVPFEMIADYLARLARSLIIEFVPKEDRKVRELLSSREDVFADYDQTSFEQAFSTRFDIRRSERIEGSPRTLYLMTRRAQE